MAMEPDQKKQPMTITITLHRDTLLLIAALAFLAAAILLAVVFPSSPPSPVQQDNPCNQGTRMDIITSWTVDY
jgi:hypothetical protein